MKTRVPWQVLLLCLAASATSSCTGTSEDADAEPWYVTFNGSATGAWVSDVDGDKVRFRITQDHDYLEWNGATYNMYMDHLFSSEVFDGSSGSTVGYVILASAGDRNIAVLVTDEGDLFDISSNADGSLHMESSDLFPSPPSAGGGGGGTACGSTAACQSYSSACESNSLAQAACYCAAACLCAACNDPCEASNRQLAASLGTTCSY